jgi:uncharacterized protein (DUF58 family)
MNPSIFPQVPVQRKAPSSPAYADLMALVRVQFKARGFSFLPWQPVHSLLAGRHASRLRGRGLNFEEIRRYLPGDDIRNMDWKATVRLRKPHVRVYTEERDRPVLLLVDQRQTMFFGSRRTMKSVTAAEVTALSAWRVFGAGDRVGSLIFNDSEIVEIRPHRSRDTVMRILQETVRQNRALRVSSDTSPNPGMINEAFRRAERLAKHDFLVVSIGDGYGADDQTVRLVTRITAHNDALAAFIYDPLEADLPDAGRLSFEESGAQIEVDTSQRRLRDDFRTAFEARRKWIHEMSRKRAMPVIPVSTVSDPAEQIREHLGHHSGVRR